MHDDDLVSSRFVRMMFVHRSPHRSPIAPPLTHSPTGSIVWSMLASSAHTSLTHGVASPPSASASRIKPFSTNIFPKPSSYVAISAASAQSLAAVAAANARAEAAAHPGTRVLTLDRDPGAVAAVLDFIQFDRKPDDSVDEDDAELLEKEAKFFGSYFELLFATVCVMPPPSSYLFARLSVGLVAVFVFWHSHLRRPRVHV